MDDKKDEGVTDLDKKEESETDPALPKNEPEKQLNKDQISSVIGEVGRWQLEKILIVFLASAPGEECRNS